MYINGNMFNENLLAMAKQRWWPSWHAEQVDACRRLVGDLELKILGCFFVLGTGNT
jgi:hypothetical protein